MEANAIVPHAPTPDISRALAILGHPPTRWQHDLFTWVAAGTGNAVVEAKAGSAKTSSALAAAALMRGRALYCAFNTAIREEAGEKAKELGLEHLSVRTMHSIGWAAIRRGHPAAAVNRWKLSELMDLAADAWSCLRQRRGNPWRQWVNAGLSWAKATLMQLPNTSALPEPTDEGYDDALAKLSVEAGNLAQHSGCDTATITLVEEQPVLAWDLLTDFYRRSWEERSMVDFDDQVWMGAIDKSLWVEQFDWVIVDEAQDTNPAQRALLKRMVKRGGRMLALADRHQAIYEWRAAGAGVVDKLIRDWDAKVLALPTCFRCPTSVLGLAQQVAQDIRARSGAPEGTVRPGKLAEAQAGDAVLCRRNGPLLGACMQAIAAGKRARILGKAAGDALVGLADDIFKSAKFKVEVNAETWMMERVAYRERMATKLGDREEAIESLDDSIKALKAITKGWRMVSVDAIKARVAQVFSDDKQDGITFSTVHRAKGLEFPRVFVLEPWTMPADARTGQHGELCVWYVAVTRAQDELVVCTTEPEENLEDAGATKPGPLAFLWPPQVRKGEWLEEEMEAYAYKEPEDTDA